MFLNFITSYFKPAYLAMSSMCSRRVFPSSASTVELRPVELFSRLTSKVFSAKDVGLTEKSPNVDDDKGDEKVDGEVGGVPITVGNIAVWSGAKGKRVSPLSSFQGG